MLDVRALSAPEPRPFDPDLVRATVAHVRQKQARALHYKGDLENLDRPATGLSIAQLAKACQRDLMGLRALARLLVKYDTGFRRSEMVAIDVGDIDGPDQKGEGRSPICRLRRCARSCRLIVGATRAPYCAMARSSPPGAAPAPARQTIRPPRR